MTKKIPVSVCIITFNEEKNIERLLKSIQFCNEIIIVDSGSKDRTLQICKKYTKKIVYREFDNYISQKNYSILLAKNEWILSLDADEEVSNELKEELQNLFSKKQRVEPLVSGFFMPRLTYYLDRWIWHSGWYPNYQLRFFQKNKGQFSGSLVHERVKLEGGVHYLKSPIHHYSYKNISDHLKFIDRYSTLSAMEKFEKNKKSGLIKSLINGFYKFIYMYFVRLGFLDGKTGLIIAIMGFYYSFLKYIKLYELQKKKI